MLFVNKTFGKLKKQKSPISLEIWKWILRIVVLNCGTSIKQSPLFCMNYLIIFLISHLSAAVWAKRISNLPWLWHISRIEFESWHALLLALKTTVACDIFANIWDFEKLPKKNSTRLTISVAGSHYLHVE